MDKLPGDYIAGFVDGEGCFALKFRRDVRNDRPLKPVYFYWDMEFAIELRGDDVEILKQIQNTLECGRIMINKKGNARYAITNLDELTEKVVIFFEKYTLRAKKKFDFILWREALQILQRNRQKNVSRKGHRGASKIPWSESDLSRLQQIQENMRTFKAARKDWKWLAQANPA